MELNNILFLLQTSFCVILKGTGKNTQGTKNGPWGRKLFFSRKIFPPRPPEYLNAAKLNIYTFETKF